MSLVQRIGLIPVAWRHLEEPLRCEHVYDTFQQTEELMMEHLLTMSLSDEGRRDNTNQNDAVDPVRVAPLLPVLQPTARVRRAVQRRI